MAVNLSAKKYLVIDDFSDMRSMLRSMLVAYGVTSIDVAGNAKDALKLLAKNNYDVVLCDYNLGDGKDGQQILEEARDKGLIQNSTAFLMLTAENTMEMVMGAVEYLPDDYLSKPFNKDMLRSRLEKVLLRKEDFHEIDKLLKKNLYGDAVALCDEKIAQNPRNLTELLKFKADILLRSRKYGEARAIFDEVLAKRDVPWAMIGLGKVYFHTQKYPEAKELFRKIIVANHMHMEAYDWLAKTLVELGERKEAVNILTAATEISPKAILRQMQLGNLALKETDLVVATKAFKKAVHIGCNSIYQTPANYTKLAKITAKSSGKDALAILAKLRGDYGRDDAANLYAAIAESLILKDMGRDKDARKACADAANLFAKCGENASKDLVMEMANACMTYGDKDKGLDLFRELLKDHREDQELLAQVRESFAALGIAAEGEKMIEAARLKKAAS
jgi:DNA-binding response OmpR family regulator